MASIIIIAIVAQAVYAIITLYERGRNALYREYVSLSKDIEAQSALLRIRVIDGDAYVRSSATLHVLGSYLIRGDGGLLKFRPLTSTLTSELRPFFNSTLVSKIESGQYKAFIVFSGGKYVLIDPSTLNQGVQNSGTLRLTGDVISEVFAQLSSPVNFTTPSQKLFHIEWFTYFVEGVAPQTISLNTLYKLVISGEGAVNSTFFNVTEAVSGTSWESAFFVGTVIYYNNIRYANLTLIIGFKTPYSYYFLPSSYSRGVLGRVAYLVFPASYSPTKPFNVILRILSTSFPIATQVPLLHRVVKAYNYSGRWSGWTVVDVVPVYVNLTDAPPQGYILIGFEGGMCGRFTYYQEVKVNSYG